MEVNFKNILECDEDLTIHGEGLTDGDTFVFKDESTKVYMIADGESQNKVRRMCYNKMGLYRLIYFRCLSARRWLRRAELSSRTYVRVLN